MKGKEAPCHIALYVLDYLTLFALQNISNRSNSLEIGLLLVHVYCNIFFLMKEKEGFTGAFIVLIYLKAILT